MQRIGRRRAAALVLIVAGASALVAGPANAGLTADCSPVADFNDDGWGDLAAGIPGEKIDGKDGAGAVNVILGGPSGVSNHDQLWHLARSGVDGTPGSGENFGDAVATGDFNGDGRSDLAIGTPGDAGSGAVNVLYGSTTGLRANAGGGAADDQRFTQSTSGIADSPESGDGFGSALAAGDFNGDGRDDLAIGVPSEDDGGTANAGAVEILYGSGSGLSTSASQFLTQGAGGIDDAREGGDRFGASLAACNFSGDAFVDLAIGVPFEDVSGTSQAGAVSVVYGSGSGLDAGGTPSDQFITQADADIAGDGAQAEDRFGHDVAAADFNGDGAADLAVGVPFENLGGAGNVGAAHVIYGWTSGLQLTGSGAPDDQAFSQLTDGVDDTGEGGDLFGYAVAGGDFNDDGVSSLAVGVPGEDIAGVTNAGLVHVLEGDASGIDPTEDLSLHQGLGNFPGEPEHGDRFGKVLGVGDYGGSHAGAGYGPNDLGIGVPQENIGSVANAGTVVVLYGGSGVDFNIPARISQEGPHFRGSPQGGDRYGASVD